MQGYRNERIGIGQQFAASARHPTAHHGRKVEPVGIFGAVYQSAGDIVIADDGASSVVSRWIGDRFHRQQTGPWVVGKGNTQPHAIGRFDEREFRPACRAKPFALAERTTAGWAELRQAKIKDEPKGRSHALAQASPI